MWRLLFSRTGRILFTEAVDAMKQLLDKNKDGKISAKEWEHGFRAPERFIKWIRKER